jgi:GGDEF domain-containing protein
MRAVGATMRSSTRLVDRPARLGDHDVERFVVILPETDHGGCEVLAQRLDTAVRGVLQAHSVQANGSLAVRSLAYPDDRRSILDLREFAIDVDIKRRVLPEQEATV